MHQISAFKALVPYLYSLLEAKQSKNSSFSMRAWAKMLGYNSGAFLSQILNGKRKANIQLIKAICKLEKLSIKDEKLLQILYVKHLMSNEVSESIDELFNSIDSKSIYSYEFLEKFSHFSSYIPFYIVELINLLGKSASFKKIYKTVSKSMTKDELTSSLNLLVNSDLLSLENDIYKRQPKCRVTFDPKIANASVKMFHQSSLDAAKKAINEQQVEDRNLSSSILPLDKENYLEACKIIKEAHDKISKISKKSSDSSSLGIYQFNAQLYMPISNRE